MPVNEGNFGFNVGRDCQLVLIGPFGQIDLNNVTGFDAKQQTATVRVKRLDGRPMFAELPDGWSGSFDLERGDPSVDFMFAAAESAWLLAGVYNVSTIYQYVAETDGSTSVFQFTNCSLKLDDAGSWRGDQSVKVRISFMAEQRQVV